ncbi:transposase family protein [Zooshikella ganghwensis]|uniref:transposase family protein n=1 Tax=Zooshikella ganghwensis TaxID=202772 RepID=UPI0013FD5B19
MEKNNTIADHFSHLDDPRVERHRRHTLVDIITITICAALCGADDWVAIERFGKAKEAWFQGFLEWVRLFFNDPKALKYQLVTDFH